MVKVICDRCGKEISDMFESYCRIDISPKSPSGYGEELERYFELCSNCTYDLIKFIEGKNNGNN